MRRSALKRARSSGWFRTQTLFQCLCPPSGTFITAGVTCVGLKQRGVVVPALSSSSVALQLNDLPGEVIGRTAGSTLSRAARCSVPLVISQPRVPFNASISLAHSPASVSGVEGFCPAGGDSAVCSFRAALASAFIQLQMPSRQRAGRRAAGGPCGWMLSSERDLVVSPRTPNQPRAVTEFPGRFPFSPRTSRLHPAGRETSWACSRGPATALHSDEHGHPTQSREHSLLKLAAVNPLLLTKCVQDTAVDVTLPSATTLPRDFPVCDAGTCN